MFPEPVTGPDGADRLAPVVGPVWLPGLSGGEVIDLESPSLAVGTGAGVA